MIDAPGNSQSQVEAELQLEAPVEVLRAALRHARGSAAPRLRASRTRFDYFDTPDLALRRAGLWLSLEPKGKRYAQRLAWITDSMAGLSLCEAEQSRVAEAAPRIDLVKARVLRDRLREAASPADVSELVASAVLTRTRATVVVDGAPLAVRLELGAVRAGEVETSIARLVLAGPEPEALFRYALALHEVNPTLRPVDERAEARAIASCAGRLSRIERLRAIAVDRDATLDVWLTAALAECSRQLTANYSAARAGHSEAIHQMRVGARAYRTILRLFRRELPASEATPLRDELAVLARALGRVRDWDVLIGHTLEPLAEREVAVVPLCALARSARALAQGALVDMLDSPVASRLLLSAGLFSCGSSWRAHVLDERGSRVLSPARGAVIGALASSQARIERAWRRVGRLSPAQRHRLRVRIKQSRYGAELAAPLLGRAATRYARRAAKLQDRLGAETDAAAACELVGELVRGETSAELLSAAAFVRGWIAAHVERRGTQLRRRLSKLARAAAEIG